LPAGCNELFIEVIRDVREVLDLDPLVIVRNPAVRGAFTLWRPSAEKAARRKRVVFSSRLAN
jgi:hypothetical protein